MTSCETGSVVFVCWSWLLASFNPPHQQHCWLVFCLYLLTVDVESAQLQPCELHNQGRVLSKLVPCNQFTSAEHVLSAEQLPPPPRARNRRRATTQGALPTLTCVT